MVFWDILCAFAKKMYVSQFLVCFINVNSVKLVDWVVQIFYLLSAFFFLSTCSINYWEKRIYSLHLSLWICLFIFLAQPLSAPGILKLCFKVYIHLSCLYIFNGLKFYNNKMSFYIPTRILCLEVYFNIATLYLYIYLYLMFV